MLFDYPTYKTPQWGFGKEFYLSMYDLISAKRNSSSTKSQMPEYMNYQTIIRVIFFLIIIGYYDIIYCHAVCWTSSKDSIPKLGEQRFEPKICFCKHPPTVTSSSNSPHNECPHKSKILTAFVSQKKYLILRAPYYSYLCIKEKCAMMKIMNIKNCNFFLCFCFFLWLFVVVPFYMLYYGFKCI